MCPSSFKSQRFEWSCSPLVGLGAGSDADSAASDAGDLIGSLGAGVDNKTASNHALLTNEADFIVIDLDVGNAILVSYSFRQVTNELLAFAFLIAAAAVVSVRAITIAITITEVSAERGASTS